MIQNAWLSNGLYTVFSKGPVNLFEPGCFLGLWLVMHNRMNLHIVYSRVFHYLNFLDFFVLEEYRLCMYVESHKNQKLKS